MDKIQMYLSSKLSSDPSSIIVWRFCYKMYLAIDESMPSLHRESTDSLLASIATPCFCSTNSLS